MNGYGLTTDFNPLAVNTVNFSKTINSKNLTALKITHLLNLVLSKTFVWKKLNYPIHRKGNPNPLCVVLFIEKAVND
jgi:hypothetical protein